MKILKIGILLIILCVFSFSAFGAMTSVELVGLPENNTHFHPLTSDVGFEYMGNSSTDNPFLASATLWGNFSGTWAPNETSGVFPQNGSAETITATLPDGYYIWNVEVCDSGDCMNATTNNSFTLDTVSPTGSTNTSNPNVAASGAILDQNWIFYNINMYDLNFMQVEYLLENVTEDEVNETIYTSYVYSINWTNLPEGFYTYSAQVRELSNGKTEIAGLGITLDRSAPTITLSSPANLSADTDRTVAFTYTPTDLYSNISNCSLYLGGVLNTTDTTITNGSANVFTITDIEESTSLNWSVTCWDALNHSNGSATWFVDTTYVAPAAASSSSPSSSGGSLSSAGVKTYTASNDIKEGSYEKVMQEEDKIKFSFDGEEHQLRLDSLTKTGTYKAKITVSSNPITFYLSEGGSKSLDLDGDGIEEIKVTAKNLDSDEAEIVIMPLSEVIGEEPVEEVSTETNETGEAEMPEEEIVMTWWIWLVIAMLVIALVLGFAMKHHKK